MKKENFFINIATVVIYFAISMIFVGCNSEERPSSVADKWVSAILNKDKETFVKYTYAPKLTDEEKLNIFEADIPIRKYEIIKDDKRFTNGDNATVIAIVTTEKDDETFSIEIFLIKTEVDGWKVDLKKMIKSE